jgi:hypothetical protein
MRRFFLALLMTVWFASCSDHGTSPDYSWIAEPRDRWKAYQLHDYTIGQTLMCFCPDGGTEFEISVRRDTIYSVVGLDNGIRVPSDQWGRYRTVNGLFELISSINPGGVAVMQVTYDPALGLPTSIYVDMNATAADDEYRYITRLISPHMKRETSLSVGIVGDAKPPVP